MTDRKLGAVPIPRVDSEIDPSLLLVGHAGRISERGLLRRWPAAYDWAQNRDLVTLDARFDLTCHSVVMGVIDGPSRNIWESVR